MTKLAKYLKPYALPLLFALVLLFGQAIANLYLPTFMSDIVNCGIQQSGIESAAPQAVSAKGLSFLKLFMTEDQKREIDQNYRLITSSESGTEHDEYVSQYPLLKAEDIYVLKTNGTETEEQIGNLIGESAWTMIGTLKDVQGFSSSSGSFSATSELSSSDLTQLYALRPMLEKVPSSVFEKARDGAAKNQDLFQQTAVVLTKSFYQELGVDTGKLQSNYIFRTGLLMLLVTLAGGVATVLVGFYSAKISAGVSRDLRRDLFARVENFSSHEFDRFSTASLITRTTNDITQIQMLLIMGIRMICYSPMLAVGGIIMALQKSPSMGWTIALACIVLLGLVAVVFSISLPKFKRMQKLIDRLNLVARESLTGLMVIRAFGTQGFEEKRFDRSNRDLTDNTLFVGRVMSVMFPMMMLIMNGVSALIIWVGAHQIAESGMPVGDMIAFMQYAMQIIMSFLMIAFIFIMVPRAAVSGNRIAEVLGTQPSIKDPSEPVAFRDGKKGYVEFENVSFRYHGAEEDVLQNITFTAKPGQTTAFIGSTGSGKTTLVNLIPRFYDVTGGCVKVNGTDVRSVSQKDLRDQIGYVPQKGILFSGTIESNLKYGDREVSDEEMKEAAVIAQAADFIEEKPEGFQAEISQSGANVSGGQKQRLSIARALAKKAPIYVFDDSFSALDFKTDAALRRALKEQTSSATVLIVAQRVSTIMNAEQIIVLDEGRVVGRGTHRELLKSCPTYYEIASSQLSGREMA